MTGFDLAGTAIGRVALDKVISGREVADGDVVIGVRSSGVHSNGLSLARRAFFASHKYRADHKFDELAVTLGEELLRPTDIYVAEAMEIIEGVRGVKALINITGDGLLNLLRVDAPVGFDIDAPIEPHPIFDLIQHHAEVSDREMFEVFNMGVGFCYVVDPSGVEQTLSILRRHGRATQPIGRAVADPEKKLRIPERNLVGRESGFADERSGAKVR